MDDLLKTRRRLTEQLAAVEARIAGSGDAPIARAFRARAHPFDCPLVRVADLVERFGGSKEAAATFLRANGAVQLPRTTQGGGVPAITLWSLRDHERLPAKSARARVAIYLEHRALHPFDPLEL